MFKQSTQPVEITIVTRSISYILRGKGNKEMGGTKTFCLLIFWSRCHCHKRHQQDKSLS